MKDLYPWERLRVWVQVPDPRHRAGALVTAAVGEGVAKNVETGSFNEERVAGWAARILKVTDPPGEISGVHIVETFRIADLRSAQ